MKRYEIALWGIFPMTYSVVKGSAALSKAIASHSQSHNKHKVARIYQMFD